jgi:hypothetical protein
MKNFMEILLERDCFYKTDGSERLYSYSDIESAFNECKESVPAETLVSQPSEPTFGQWIDAKVELPKPIDKGYAKSIRVIGCWGDSADNIAEVDFEETIIRGKEVKRFKWNNIICPWNIIKWMPLPKP